MTARYVTDIFNEHHRNLCVRTDRMFAVLMFLQWLAGLAAAYWISPKAWAGLTSQIHPHVWAALLLGGAITLLPVSLALARPGRLSTRFTIAVGQMLMGALLIHLTGGRVETHFHIFGSLAFLSFYRDWRVIVPATIVVAADHFLRGVFWSQSIYGVFTVSHWRWLEHVSWVLFEDTFLLIAIRRGVREMYSIAERTAESEDLNADLERRVIERTSQLEATNQTLGAEVAERKLAEEALRASEERYRLLFESNPQPMWAYDLDTLRFLAVNEIAIQRYGYSRTEFLGMTIKDIRPADDVPLLLDDVSKGAGGYQMADKWRHRKKDGQLINVEICSHGLTFAGRRARLVLANDITERRWAEAAREVIFDVATGISMSSNLDDLLHLVRSSIRKVLYAEHCFIALYDKQTELFHIQLMVDKYDDAPPPQRMEKSRTAYVFRTGRPTLMTDDVFRQLATEGEVESMGTPPAVWLGVPLRTPAEIIGVLVVQHYEDPNAYSERDIEFLASVGGQIALAIERKRAEEELRKSAAKLERSNRELQDFASIASHDLQEPLRKIQAFGDRLKSKCADALGDQGRDYLERMQSAAGRMQTLINDLLTFSRVTTKAQPFVSVNLEEIAQGVLSDLETRIEQTGGRVEVGSLPTIDADPLQMRQLLQNLIGNALKFRRPEEPSLVRVNVQPFAHADQSAALDGADALCQLVIEDNGIGFEEKYLDRIFTVFQRLHSRNEYEGTGVGLAVCRKIAERHGGQITARSAPNTGATFIITLPVKQTEVHAQ